MRQNPNQNPRQPGEQNQRQPTQQQLPQQQPPQQQPPQQQPPQQQPPQQQPPQQPQSQLHQAGSSSQQHLPQGQPPQQHGRAAPQQGQPVPSQPSSQQGIPPQQPSQAMAGQSQQMPRSGMQQGTMSQQSQSPRGAQPQAGVGMQQPQQMGGGPSPMQSVSIDAILQGEVVTADLDTPIPTLTSQMKKERVGSVVITEDNEPRGIVTDRKIALSLEEMPDLAEKTAKDIMSEDLTLGEETMSVHEALQQMSDEDIRRLPIVDEDGHLVGIVTLDDILVLLGEELQESTEIIKSQSPRL